MKFYGIPPILPPDKKGNGTRQPPADNITTEHEQRFTAQGIKIKAIKAGYHKENEKQNNGQNLFRQKESVVEKTMDKK